MSAHPVRLERAVQQGQPQRVRVPVVEGVIEPLGVVVPDEDVVEPAVGLGADLDGQVVGHEGAALVDVDEPDLDPRLGREYAEDVDLGHGVRRALAGEPAGAAEEVVHPFGWRSGAHASSFRSRNQ